MSNSKIVRWPISISNIYMCKRKKNASRRSILAVLNKKYRKSMISDIYNITKAFSSKLQTSNGKQQRRWISKRKFNAFFLLQKF